MNAKDLATLINGREIDDEITREEEQEAKKNCLVVVFGASDDLIELRGAIQDECEAWEGTTIRVTHGGILDAPNLNERDFCIHRCKYFKEIYSKAQTIKAVWHDEGNPCWTYETDIPHETFDIMEDGEVYCRGIVFSMGDLKEV